MSNDYKVHKAWIKEAEFEILVLEIPIAEIDDKLAYLARDKGNIAKSFYEDFVIATCVANINQLLFHIKQQNGNPANLMEIRQEVMDRILTTNKSFEPSNLVINRNAVVKLKDKDGVKKDERLLTENKGWEVSYYDDMTDTYGGDPEVSKNLGKNKDKKNEKKATSEMKNIEDLDFEIIKQWWKRINRYIEIKKFDEKDVASILNKRFFHSRSSFQTYIVTVCVVGSEDLFIMLDDMGIPARVAPPILVHEVYELCKDLNPFLTYDNSKEFSDDSEEDEEDNSRPNRAHPPNKMASHARQQRLKRKKKKKKFKDVPKEDLLNLNDAMKIFVIGQDEAIDQIVNAVQRASVGLKDPVKPIGSFLFAGRTGIGKTLTTKILADELIKDRNNLITIDCSEYSADHEYAKLIGAPSGYVGHEQGGILTNAVIESPFSVIVLDEIEKASHKVHEILLQILEEGRLTDGKGQKVSFSDSIIIMTSNIGVLEVDSVKKTIGFGDVAKLTENKTKKAIDKAIKSKFKPEFLNRIDSTVHFSGLSKSSYMRVIDIELFKLNENLKLNDTEFKKLTLKFDKKVRFFIYKHGIDEDYGARPLKRSIEREISTPLAARLLRGDIGLGDKVTITVRKGKIDFDVEQESKPRPKEKTMSVNK